jgi:hypothetical protein
VGKYLGYRFFVSKPAEVLVIGDFDLEEEQLNQLLSVGAWVRTPEQFKRELRRGFVYNHSFIAFEPSTGLEDLIDFYKTALPVRRIVAAGLIDLIKERLLAGRANELEEHIRFKSWSDYFELIRGDSRSVILLSSPQAGDAGVFRIILSDHNNTYPSSKKTYLSESGGGATEHSIDFLEPLSSRAQSRLPGYRDADFADYLDRIGEDSGGSGEAAVLQIFEAARAKVIVLDERIQRYASTGVYSSDGVNVPVAEIFKFTQVVVPSAAEIKLDEKNFEVVLRDKILSYIDGHRGTGHPESLPKAIRTFLLVHFSILERMFANEEASIRRTLIDWASDFEVIVTSGRGKPKTLPFESVRFAHLSPVLNVFTENRSKYAIVKLLDAARR